MKMSFKICALVWLIATTAGAPAEELGRLFFTPAQRTELNFGKFQASDGSADNASLTVNGIVQQSGGKRTVWINGISRTAGKSDERNPESLPVTLPNQALPLTVKVGQKINITPTSDSKP